MSASVRPYELHRYRRIGAVLVLAALTTAGCTQVAASDATPPPTYIPQPTPDATMAVVIQGGGLPVTYFPPLEVKGSPTPVPAAGRPRTSAGSSTGTNSRPAAKPTQAPRESAPVRAPTAAPKPAAPREPAPAPKPAPTAVRAAPSSGNSGSNAGGSSGQPAIINPNTVLPGGARPTPGR